MTLTSFFNTSRRKKKNSKVPYDHKLYLVEEGAKKYNVQFCDGYEPATKEFIHGIAVQEDCYLTMPKPGDLIDLSNQNFESTQMVYACHNYDFFSYDKVGDWIHISDFNNALVVSLGCLTKCYEGYQSHSYVDAILVFHLLIDGRSMYVTGTDIQRHTKNARIFVSP